MEPNMNKIFFLTMGTLLLTQGTFAADLQTQELPVSEMKKQKREIVKLSSEEINKTMPQVVDTYTTLRKVEGKDTTLVYTFEINTGAKSDETVRNEDKSRMKKAVTKGICQSASRFIEADISISYIYVSAVSKAKLFQFDVSKKDCPKKEVY